MRIENVIFDIGNVLLSWDTRRIVEAFTDDEAFREKLLEKVFAHEDWPAMDRGELTEAEAVANMCGRTGCERGLIERLMADAKESLAPIERSVALIDAARDAGRGVYILSNMCEEVYAFIASKFPFLGKFDDEIISAREKIAKPDAAIFELAAERFGVEPGRTLFIDDVEANVSAAHRAGFRAVRFVDTDECVAGIVSMITPSGK